jgi:hypothetical protein
MPSSTNVESSFPFLSSNNLGSPVINEEADLEKRVRGPRLYSPLTNPSRNVLANLTNSGGPTVDDTVMEKRGFVTGEEEGTLEKRIYKKAHYCALTNFSIFHQFEYEQIRATIYG